MNIEALAKEIEPLAYVLMRNWEVLPPNGDMDFFVHPGHQELLENACKKHLGDQRWFDIRTVGDGYYPPEIEGEMLNNKRLYSTLIHGEAVAFWIPSPQAHFLSLYYHQLIHKGDHRYQEKLDKSFAEWMRPVKPKDPGVGFHDSYQN